MTYDRLEMEDPDVLQGFNDLRKKYNNKAELLWSIDTIDNPESEYGYVYYNTWYLLMDKKQIFVIEDYKHEVDAYKLVSMLEDTIKEEYNGYKFKTYKEKYIENAAIDAIKYFEDGSFDLIHKYRICSICETIDSRTDYDIIMDHYTFIIKNSESDNIALSLEEFKNHNIQEAIKLLSLVESNKTIKDWLESLIKHLKRMNN